MLSHAELQETTAALVPFTATALLYFLFFVLLDILLYSFPRDWHGDSNIQSHE